MGTFLDTFLPALSGDAAKVLPAGMQGQGQGINAAQQLALLDAQMKNQQAHTDLFKKQAQMYGTPKQTAELLELQLLQQGLATDPNFLNTPMGQVLGSRIGHAAYGDRGKTIVGGPGSTVFRPGQDPMSIPHRPVVVGEGASVLMPGSTALTTAPQKAKTVGAGGAVIDPNQSAGQGLLYQAPSKAQGPGGRQITVTERAKEKLAKEGPEALSPGEKALLRLEPKAPTNKQRDVAEGFTETFGLLDTIEKNFNPAWVGPVAGMGTKASVMTDVLNSEQKSVFASSLQSLFNALLKLRSGAAVTESEFRRLQQELPTLTVPPRTFLARMDLFRNLLDAKRQAWDTGKVVDLSSMTPTGHRAAREATTPLRAQPNPSNPIGAFNAADAEIRAQHPDWDDNKIFSILKAQGF